MIILNDVFDRTDNAFDEILALIKSIPHVKVFEANHDENDLTLVGDGNTFTPYIVVSFSGSAATPKRSHAISGARDSGERVAVVVRVVASSGGITRSVMKSVKKKLLGFKPTGCGELKNAFYFSSGLTSNLGTPSRNTAVQSFEFEVS